jgi:hypothetical protein
MDDTAEQLHWQIERAQEGLKEDLHALESKASEAIDWRAQFEKRPLLMLGLAAGGGALASSLIGGSKHRERSEVDPTGAPQYRAPQPPSPGAEKMRHIRDTLAALAAGVATDLLHEAIPGFKEQFEKVKDRIKDASQSVHDQQYAPMRSSTDRRQSGRVYNSPDT